MSWHSSKSSIHFVEKIVYCHIAGRIGRTGKINGGLIGKIKEAVVVYPHILSNNITPSGYSAIANTYRKAWLKHEYVSINIHAICMKHNSSSSIKVGNYIISKSN